MLKCGLIGPQKLLKPLTQCHDLIGFKMEIIIDFDDDLLKKYNTSIGPLLFDFCVQNEKLEYYPEKEWLDFGAVILGWWSTEIIDIANGKNKGELLFMDGPYQLTYLVKNDSILIWKGEEVSEDSFFTEISKRDFCKCLITKINEVIRNFRARKISHNDLISMEKTLPLLKKLTF